MAKINKDDLKIGVTFTYCRKCDRVEVVRCWECTHCDPYNKHCDHPMGTTLPQSRRPNDYCSYGERKDCIDNNL